jgi:hypothetical protein
VIFEKKVPLLSCSGRRRRHGQLNSLYLARVQAAGGGLNNYYCKFFSNKKTKYS